MDFEARNKTVPSSVQSIYSYNRSETEKFAHVTFFFNGGIEAQYPLEDRELIPSPKVATYDLKPEMSALEVGKKVAETIEKDIYPFVMCNFAPPVTHSLYNYDRIWYLQS